MKQSRVLLLGGIHEGRWLAEALHHKGFEVTYCLAGKARIAKLPCAVMVGGFQRYSDNAEQNPHGHNGLANFLRTKQFHYVVDCTHPYAAQMSRNAAAAARVANIPCWRYLRPSWLGLLDNAVSQSAALKQRLGLNNSGSKIVVCDHGPELWQHLAAYQRVFFSTGSSALDYLAQRRRGQHWLIRTAQAKPTNDLQSEEEVSLLTAIGPFSLPVEQEIYQQHAYDVLISKDSGGEPAAKLAVALAANVDIVLLQRPRLATVEREFADINALFEAFSQAL